MAKQSKKTAGVQRTSNGKGKGYHANSGSFQPGNPYRLKPGFDPRRNLNGRPKDHDELQALIREIAAQVVDPENGLTILQNMILSMIQRGDSRDHANVLEHGWGKVLEQIKQDLTHHGAIPVQAVNYQESIKALKPDDTVTNE